MLIAHNNWAQKNKENEKVHFLWLETQMGPLTKLMAKMSADWAEMSLVIRTEYQLQKCCSWHWTELKGLDVKTAATDDVAADVAADDDSNVGLDDV